MNDSAHPRIDSEYQKSKKSNWEINGLDNYGFDGD
jgi:hypothetical protein